MAGTMAYLSKEEKQKIKNALKIKKSLDKEEDNRNLRVSSPESEDVDFKKVIHPLGYYIHDREQMIEEMFSIIKGEKLRKMLPPLLKTYTFEELKADCLVHLLGMSRKRIMAILEGRELNSSSDSESECSTTTSEPDEAPKSLNNKFESRLNIDDDDLLDISISEKDVDSLMKEKPKVPNKSKKSKVRVRKKIKTEKDLSLFSIVISDDDLDDTSIKKTKKINRVRASNKSDKILGSKEKGKKRKKGETHSKSNTNGNTCESTGDEKKKLDRDATASLDKNDKGKTLLEILELEMRARAIRALLKNTSDVEEGSSVLSDNVKSRAEAATKSDSKIPSAIVEAIDQTLSDKNTAEPNDDLSESGNDVEIIDDIDLCVTIDDDDEISLETPSEIALSRTNANEKCDSSKDNHSEKDQPSEAGTSEKSKPAEEDSEKHKPPKDNSEKCKLSKDNAEKSKPSKEDSVKCKTLKNNSVKSKLLKDNSEKCNPLKDDAANFKSSKDFFKKCKPSKLDGFENHFVLKGDSEKFKASISDNSEKLESSAEKGAEKYEPPKEKDTEKRESLKENDDEKCEPTKDNTSEKSEGGLINSTDNITWSERWAEKQNVKDVVRNSKICANIRKRMRFARMLKQKQSEVSKQITDEIDISHVEESSVAHYNLIKAYTSKNVDNTNDDSKAAVEQSNHIVETSQEVPNNNDSDADITTEDHTLTILESDPKTLIINISDDDVIPDSPSLDNSQVHLKF